VRFAVFAAAAGRRGASAHGEQGVEVSDRWHFGAVETLGDHA
jgi:hypothetical protein